MEKLFTCGREPGGKFLCALETCPPKFILGHTHEDAEHKVRIVVDSEIAQETGPVSRFAFDVEDLVLPVLDNDQDVTLVVVTYHFIVLDRDPEAVQVRTFSGGGELGLDHSRVTLVRKLDFLCAHDAVGPLDKQKDCFPAEPFMLDDNISRNL